MDASENKRCAVVVVIAVPSLSRATLYEKAAELVREHEDVYHA